jgi:hypothetical protein
VACACRQSPSETLESTFDSSPDGFDVIAVRRSSFFVFLDKPVLVLVGLVDES